MRWGRLVVAAVALGLLSGALQMLLVGVVAGPRLIAELRAMFDPVPTEVLARCAADPTSFHVAGRGWDAWAYGDDLVSANPAAPAVPLRIAARLSAGEERPAQGLGLGTIGGAAAWRTGLDGPCAVAVVAWPPLAGVWGSLLATQLLSTGLIGAASAAGCAALVARPLARRIDQLARATRRFGTADWEAPALDGELAPLSSLLDDAHRRVVREHDAEEATRLACERRLARLTHDLAPALDGLRARVGALAGRVDPRELEGLAAEVVAVTALTSNLRRAVRGTATGDVPVTDLANLVAAVHLRLLPHAARRGVRCELTVPEGPVPVRAPPALLEQLVWNLGHNAVTHPPAGARAALELRREPDGFALHVLDNGPGLPDAARERLGRRGEEAAGLAIAADSCREAGFDLSVASYVGDGTALVIRGPLAT